MNAFFDLDLEVIMRRPVGPAGTPLLFVHGAFAGAWTWDEHFLPWFAERGYPAYAVSLRGHGQSAGRASINDYSIADYVDDVTDIARRIDPPPVLIGHSMGGFVVQKYFEREQAVGAVLMASVPPTGLAGPGLSLAVWNPMAAINIGSIQAFGAQWRAPGVMREALFARGVAPVAAHRFLARMGPESLRAMMDMYAGGPPQPSLGTPATIMVMGAADDALLPPAFIRSTARRYGVDSRVIEDIGHLMMLDTAWPAAAQCLLDWLRKNRF